MTAVFTVQLLCADGCGRTYPHQPAATTARELRVQAAAAGWETQRHTTGQDRCPPCRIAVIRAASGSYQEGPC